MNRMLAMLMNKRFSLSGGEYDGLTECNESYDKLGGSSSVAVFLAFFATFLFVVLSIQWTFVLTAPSDPFIYVAPALRPEWSFYLPDRIVVWLWIRMVAVLPIPVEMIGGVSTLIVTASILFVATWWLAKRMQPIAGAIFGALYIVSPIVLGISTYTYPMQPMTLVLLITLVLMDSFRGVRRSLIGGIGGGIASLCKIQGMAFLGFLALDTLVQRRRRFSHLIVAIGGFVIGILIIFMIVTVIDGPSQTIRIFKLYFLRGDMQAQLHGRNLGDMPPFLKYLTEPTTIVAFAGMIWPWLNPNLYRLRPFATAAAVQTIGLIIIYAITQRGGPLIYNYSLDAVVLGLVAFAGAVTWTAKENKATENHQLLMRGILVLTIVFLVVEVYAYFSTSFTQYNPVEAGTTFAGITAAVLVWWSIFVFLVAKRLKLTGYRLRLAVISGGLLLAFGVGLRAGEGVKDGIFKRAEAAPYHSLGRQIKAISPQSVWVSVDMNLGSIEDVSFRCKQIYQAFYSAKSNELQKGYAVVFGKKDDAASLRFLLTDQAYLINKYSGLPRKALPSLNSQSIQVAASEVNKNPSHPFRLGGLRGDALFTQQGAELVIKPTDASKKLEIQLDLAPNDTLVQRLPSLFVLSVEGVNPPSDVSVKLFAQFESNGRYTRADSSVIHGSESVGIMFVIPSGAQNISFGWYIEADELNKPIRLPSVLFSSIHWLENGHPFAVIDRSDGTVAFFSAAGSRN